ncbi:MAG: tRNA (adenosine(37)-N6)-threonylcarbamoyltransferase complex transferase subunit TsaD [Bacillota bacterium]|nr:tRNA (adenosine(37)-N6)-threonylcarbamoyltransferase complex transferase subunit TsaD [Bacillota bacterium]
MLILGIESSCDETAAAVVADGRHVLSSVIHSQIDMHRDFGGVVPELAARSHVEQIEPVVTRALADAGIEPRQLDAIAVTYAPGLIGALLVGVSYAKAYADALGRPLVPVRHLDGHVAANYLSHPRLEPPFLCLIVSGGHTSIKMVTAYTRSHSIARTRDDAAGEAFDKLARALGLGYPGGPAIDRTARGGDPHAYPFTMPRFSDGSFDFSFSGLKTQALQRLNTLPDDENTLRDFCASYQQAIVDQLADRVWAAVHQESAPAVAIAGGVAANRALRERLSADGERLGIPVYLPEPRWCTDNAAMIAAAAYPYAREERWLQGPELWALDALARDPEEEAV